MPSSLRKIFAVFVLVGALPLAYIIYEYSSLNEDEELFYQIYEGQLDAILFSINQYSTDVATGWVKDLTNGLKYGEGSAKTSELLKTSDALGMVYFYSLEGKEMLVSSKGKDTLISAEQLRAIAWENQGLGEKLIHYKKAGYQKLMGLDSAGLSMYPVLFALDSGISEFTLGMLLISAEDFVGNDLSNKMQSIAGDQFVVSVNRRTDNELIFSTAQLEHGFVIADEEDGYGIERPLWLFPNYYLTISKEGTSIEKLVKSRSRNNLIVLSVIFVFLVFGLYFLFANIKRELYLSNAKSEFVSNVSHEIRTPLSLISMFAETLEMGRARTEEKKQEYYKVIRKETHRLSKIVNTILSFSKMDANKRTYHFEQLDVKDLIDEIMDNYKGQLESEGFEWSVDYDHQGKVAEADREATSEAVINLLDNAIKYSDPAKDVRIKTGIEEEWLYVEVRDQGVGIPKEYHKEIFDQFFRTPSHNIHKTKGSGLGLAIVSRIMKAHKGKVEVESVPSKGSTFRLLFPIYNQD